MTSKIKYYEYTSSLDGVKDQYKVDAITEFKVYYWDPEDFIWRESVFDLLYIVNCTRFKQIDWPNIIIN